MLEKPKECERSNDRYGVLCTFPAGVLPNGLWNSSNLVLCVESSRNMNQPNCSCFLVNVKRAWQCLSRVHVFIFLNPDSRPIGFKYGSIRILVSGEQRKIGGWIQSAKWNECNKHFLLSALHHSIESKNGNLHRHQCILADSWVAVWIVALSLCQKIMKRLWLKIMTICLDNCCCLDAYVGYGVAVWCFSHVFPGGNSPHQGIKRWRLKVIPWQLSEVFQIQESSGPAAASHHVVLRVSSLSRLDF